MKKLSGSYLLNAIVLIASATWIWFTRLPATQMVGNDLTMPRPGFIAPDFTLPTKQGQTVSLSELKGTPVVINFWASWCQPCRAEMPALQNAYQDLSASGLMLLAVNATNQDQYESALAFYEELGLSFPLLFDRDGEASHKYQINAFPTTFFIDRHGIIQDVVIGGPMSEALIRVRFEQLIGE